MLPYMASFLLFLTKSISKYPSSTNPQLPHPFAMRNFWLRTCTQALFFLQSAPSWTFGNVLNTSLGNCSVICTLTSCYVLYQTYSEFWYIRLYFFQLYSGIVNHIEGHWGLFSTLCNPRIFTTLPYSEPWHIWNWRLI